MTTHTKRTFIAISICILLIAASLPLTARALPPPPPPPPPTSTPTPPAPTPAPPSQSQPATGGSIALRMQPAYEELWQTYFWQDVWTVVQWQGLSGAWHDVAGWQGTLDKVVDGAGQKTWWVAGADLGRGPFRWVVYQNQGGPTLSTSESFYLPAASGKSVTVETALGP